MANPSTRRFSKSEISEAVHRGITIPNWVEIAGRPAYVLTGRELDTAVHALRVAAEEFDKHAVTCERDTLLTVKEAAVGRLVEQFDRQAKEARELAEKLEATP